MPYAHKKKGRVMYILPLGESLAVVAPKKEGGEETKVTLVIKQEQESPKARMFRLTATSVDAPDKVFTKIFWCPKKCVKNIDGKLHVDEWLILDKKIERFLTKVEPTVVSD